MANWKFQRSIWPQHIVSRSSQIWHIIHNDISYHSCHKSVSLTVTETYGQLKIWRSNWPWLNFSRSLQIWEESTVTSVTVINHKSAFLANWKFTIFNSYWDMAKWNFLQSIWPSHNFSRSPKILPVSPKI